VTGDEYGFWLIGECETDIVIRRLVGKATPCVGRNRELSQLEELVIESFEEPSARGAIVTGPAGMGKSRLRFELVRRVRERTPSADVWLGRAEPIAAGAAFGVLGSALRRAIGLPDGEPLGVRQRKLRARVARHFVDPEARAVAEFIGELVGTPLGEDESVALRAARNDLVLMGDRITEAFCDFASAEAAARPILLVLEDLQWGDAASVRITLAALRRARARPLFVLALGRPEAITLFPDFGPARGLTHVALGELSPKAARELVHAALATDTDSALVDEIVQRSGGHPLYLEELVRHVAEGRSGELPTTVVAMLQARLEALPPEPRRILRAGSVFGTAFWSGAVERLVGGSGRTQELRDWMPVLLEQELIERRPSTRFPGHAEYVFRHALLRDAAYSTLTDRDRTVGHALAGDWLQEQGETDPRALGEHFERAGNPERSAIWLARAGSQALEGHDVGAAVALARRARAHAGSLEPEERGRIALLEAEACAWSGELEEAGRAANEAIALFPRGSVEWLRAVEHAITASGRRGVYEIAVDWHEQIRSAPELPGASTARVLALCAAGRQAFHAGGYELADEIAEELRAQVERGEIEPRALAEIHRLLGAQARHRGDLAADLENYERALRAYEQTEDARNAENARVSLGFAYAELGEYATARAHFDHALAQSERMGLDVIATRARQNLALVLSISGELDRAEELARQVISESHSQGNVRFEGWTRIYLARILLARGKLEEAHAEAAHAAQMLEVTPPARAGALAVLACAAVLLGRGQEAELHARGALVIVESFGGIEEFESLVWLAAVRAAELAGDEARRSARLSQALARLEERAAAIEDAELRQSFLERVPENAELRALATRDSATSSDASIREAFAPELFARDAAELCAALGEHLARAIAGRGPVVDETLTPEALLQRFAGPFPPEPRPEALSGLIGDILGSAAHQHHPRYLGYQVSAALPRAALGALLAAALNSGMAAFDSGRGAVALERRVIDWMLGLLDWSGGDGMLTSGGSLGNLTALLAAREARASDAEREQGLAGSPGLVVLCGDQTHYSVARAAQIMGLGRRGVRVLPSDDRFRLDPREIPAAVAALSDEGRTPIALVASAGSTSTGAIDDLGQIAELCSELGLWLHVDGAHGASALLSEQHRAALAGIERADSIVWDAHKLMSMPALCTAVLFRSARAASGTFAQKASYLYQAPDDAAPWYDIGLRTIECTKPLMAVPLYLSLATLGTRFFGALVDRSYALARRFAVLIREAADFELACEPESNIVCFRHLPSPAVELDAHQRELRARARARGFFVVTTELRGRVWLRCTLMSPTTREEDLLALLEALRASDG
jgi:glutamate/tyrosine decarboxylase-like PLP-dependent enzyme/tetratricopeptide (TPR) repeat protein